MHSHPVDRRALSGQVSRLCCKVCKRQCGYFATKLSRLDAYEDRKVVRWCRTQASRHDSQGVVDGRINEVGVSTAEPYSSALECTRVKLTVSNVVAPAPQPEPTSRFKSASRDTSFLRGDSRCRRCVSDLSSVLPRYLGSEQKGRNSVVVVDF